MTNRRRLLSDVSLSGIRVLLVDDHASERALYSIFFRRLGAEVAPVADWDEAGRAIERSVPDVLVSTTLVLPGEPARSKLIRDLLREARARNAAMGALAVTPFARRGDRGDVLALGFDEHLPKPCKLDALAATVQRLAQSQGNGASEASSGP